MSKNTSNFFQVLLSFYKIEVSYLHQVNQFNFKAKKTYLLYPKLFENKFNIQTVLFVYSINNFKFLEYWKEKKKSK